MSAPTLDATVGGSSANSYVTVATATTYFNERLNTTAWTTAVTAADGSTERALIMATRRIDDEQFVGEPVHPLNDVTVGAGVATQALKWPRYSAEDDADWTYDYTQIPECVQRATMELALHLLNQGSTDALADTGLKPYRDVQVGSVKVTPVPEYPAGELPDEVRRLLRPVLMGSVYGFKVVRT